METGKLIGGDSFVERTPNPTWLTARLDVYEQIKARRQEEFQSKTPVDITVTMPDGKVLSEYKDGAGPFQAWKTTPHDVAVTISQGLADAATVARVTYERFVDDYSPAEDGMEGADAMEEAMEGLDLTDEDGDDSPAEAVEGGNKFLKPLLWDMTRPLVGPVARLEFLKFEDSQDAKTVFWHSSAHMMGEALEHLFGVKLTIGPPLKGGFYYDSYMGADSLKEDDCK